MIRHVLLASTASMMLSTAVYAADFIQPIVDSEVIFTQSFDWTGFYVGVNAGYGGGDAAHPFVLTVPDGGGGFDDALTGSANITAGGFLGGVQAGFNYQMDQFVFGIEADVQGSNIAGVVDVSVTDTMGFIGAPGDTLNISAGTRLDWLATIRPRLGYAHDRFLVYVTGGLAYGATTSFVDVNVNGGAPMFGGDARRNTWGWTAGAGLEYALTDNVSFKTEYLYTDLAAVNVISEDLGGGGPGPEFNMSSDLNIHTVRAGLNLRF